MAQSIKRKEAARTAEPTRSESPSEAHERAGELLKEVEQIVQKQNFWKLSEYADLAATKELLSGPPELQVAVVLHTAKAFRQIGERIAKEKGGPVSYWNLWHRPDYPRAGVELTKRILRRKLPFNEQEISSLIGDLGTIRSLTLNSVPILENVITLVEQHAMGGGSIKLFAKDLKQLQKALDTVTNAPERKVRERIERILAGPLNLD